MVCQILVDVVELFLAFSNDGHRNRNEVTVATGSDGDRVVGDFSKVLFHEPDRSDLEIVTYPSHHLDRELARKLEQRLFVFLVQLFEPELDPVARALPERAVRIIFESTKGRVDQLVAVQADL